MKVKDNSYLTEVSRSQVSADLILNLVIPNLDKEKFEQIFS